MANDPRNTWGAKFKRTLTSLLPPAINRGGGCANCGACCSLPARCPFLKYNAEGRSFCSIHFLRPMNCRKYPRTQEEFITEDTCGYRFE